MRACVLSLRASSIHVGAGALRSRASRVRPRQAAVTPRAGWQAAPVCRPAHTRARCEAIQKGTRVLISLWDSLMFGRVPKNAALMFGRVPKNAAPFLGTRPNIRESHSEISTRVPHCIVLAGACAGRAQPAGRALRTCAPPCPGARMRTHRAGVGPTPGRQRVELHEPAAGRSRQI